MGVCRLREGSWLAIYANMGFPDAQGLRDRERERQTAREEERKRTQGGQNAFEQASEGGGGEERVKSGSPCTACASKTRSSFLHLQVERRPVRHRLRKRGFSICDIVVSGNHPLLQALDAASVFSLPSASSSPAVRRVAASGSPGEKSFRRRSFRAACQRNPEIRLFA